MKALTTQFWKEMAGQLLAALAPKLGGAKLWLLKQAITYGGQAVYDLLSRWIAQLERAAEQKKAEVEKDKVISKPDHTADEAGKAYEDYYNSGRKP